MAKGEAKAQEMKTTIPQPNISKLTPTPVTAPQLNRPMRGPEQSFAANMAQSGIGGPQRQFDPAMAMQMLGRR